MEKSLTIHMGMPKTGTTAIQHLLSNVTPELAAKGIDYLSNFRGEKVAHHTIATEIKTRRDLNGPLVCGFLAHLDSVNSGQVVISSEGFTNSFAQPVLNTLIKFIEECNSRIPTKIVISLRRVDGFLESMYLHSVKVGSVSLDLGDYLGKRNDWSKTFFHALTAIRQNVGGIGFEAVKYEANEAFLGRFFDAMGIPYREIPELSSVPSENVRLGLKAQTLLLHFDQFAKRMGKELPRKRLIRDLLLGTLRFDEDLYSYSLLSFEDASRLHSRAINDSLAEGFLEYEQFFGADKIAVRELGTLDPSNLTDTDLETLKAYVLER